MKILDVSAGYRWIWFDVAYQDTVYVDKREEVAPDIVTDSRHLPFLDNVFDLIVFDPPHVNFGANANMARDYGHHTTAQIRDIVAGTGKETHRVAREDALMAFKWNDHDQSFGSMLELLASWWKPLFGHKMKGGSRSITRWAMLRRITK